MSHSKEANPPVAVMVSTEEYFSLVKEAEQLRAQLSEAKKPADNWPHCETCNFPLQDQGTPNGLVCLLCNVREQLSEAITEKEKALCDKDEEKGRIAYLREQLVEARAENEKVGKFSNAFEEKLTRERDEWKRLAEQREKRISELEKRLMLLPDDTLNKLSALLANDKESK